MVEVKSDERGSLYEAFKLPNDGQVFFVIIKPNQTRGNHYHTHKTERFLVVYGSAEIVLRHRDDDELRYYLVSGDDPLVVTIAPNIVHNITTSEGCILAVWVDKPFDENDADTYAEEV